MIDNHLCVEKVADGVWEVVTPFTFNNITVPKGFQTDFCSVPRLPLAYLFCGGIGEEAGVIHDYLYRIDSNPLVTKDEADKILLEALKYYKVGIVKRQAMYLAVKIGGGFSYHKKRVSDRLTEHKED